MFWSRTRITFCNILQQSLDHCIIMYFFLPRPLYYIVFFSPKTIVLYCIFFLPRPLYYIVFFSPKTIVLNCIFFLPRQLYYIVFFFSKDHCIILYFFSPKTIVLHCIFFSQDHCIKLYFFSPKTIVLNCIFFLQRPLYYIVFCSQIISMLLTATSKFYNWGPGLLRKFHHRCINPNNKYGLKGDLSIRVLFLITFELIKTKISN